MLAAQKLSSSGTAALCFSPKQTNGWLFFFTWDFQYLLVLASLLDVLK